ncbi:molybdopterin-dependent oxidoreductase [Caldinitratiruptor microaerophilus]|uniref:4Fe-4S Mo/W bis-MGD-type domain-containing protein n=1 Tax=Caldinitratiruptor microaerophilus TaxID=671077 RepID=A0AA35CNC1_9FIRM|nr:molybdopterin-dependent oxidoreductase [Caldinitratiruptor microaerophilus]BDG60521.1 hypothetical protein caldi_16110 [Caldinitratiruptor microaerophilus]
MATTGLSRRDFLKVSGLGAGAALVGLPRSARARAAGTERRVPTLCEMCSSRCGVFAVVRDGRVVRVEGNPDHPVNLGRPCARGNAAPASLYDPDRLRQPLKRGPDGRFRPISWEQAIQEIAAKLQELKAQYGPQTLVWAEYQNLNSGLYRRFVEAFGSPNHTGHAALCFANRNVAYAQVFGSLPSVDYKNVRYYLSPGRNLLGGVKAGDVVKLAEARAHGARIVALDPRYSELAGWADEWLPIRPATDAAFLLALAWVLVEEDLYDRDFVAGRTVGFEEFRQAIAPYTPEWAETLTDIPAATIRRIAREMAAARPAAVVDPGWHGGNGMYWNGFEAARAGAVVNALLGNLGAKGGLVMAPKVALGRIDNPPEGAGGGDGGGG